MNKFAEYTPIESNTPDSIYKYYKDNNIEIPNNSFFLEYIKDPYKKGLNELENKKIIKTPTIIKVPPIKQLPPKKVIVKTPKEKEPKEVLEKVPDKKDIFTPEYIKNEINNLGVSEEDKQYLLKLSMLESSHNPYIENSKGYYGLYQFGNLAFKSVGKTKLDFQDTVVQHNSALKLAKMNEKILKDIINNYSGSTIKGIKITKNGIRAAAHLLGARTVKDWFYNTKVSPYAKKNFKDSFGTSITKYFKEFQ